MQRRGLDLFVLCNPIDGPDDLDPARVHSRLDQVQLIERVLAVLLVPEVAGKRIERHSEAVAHAIREDLLDIGADLAPNIRARDKERVVRRRRPVVVEPENDTGKVRVVGFGPAELIVGDRRAEPGQGWPRWQVLQLPAPADVAEDHVKLSVWPETNDATVMVSSRRLFAVALIRRLRGGIVLKRAQLDQVAVESERGGRAVPDESVDPVAEQRG